MLQAPLPVDASVDSIVAHFRHHRFGVLVAPPGSGKTTRVPPALAELGRTILLQPRRVAARALARRIAAERGWTIGGEIGWHIRHERRFSSSTQLIVATEGILTARLQSDPLLSGFRVVILDEFHERSVFADVAIALAKQAAIARDDLAVLVMSATIDAGGISRYLRGDSEEPARVFDVSARRFAIDVSYRPAISPAEAVRDLARSGEGDVLVFLPGVREIEMVQRDLAAFPASVLPLHGSMSVDAQERALAPSATRKVILTTNIAETSLTVEGVTVVVDSGLQKVLRYDEETGVDHLVMERIPLDSAEQRAGRAGRLGPGRAVRLWDARDILRPHREPEVQRVDLASAALDVIAWGGDPRDFDWFETPPSDRLDAAIELLRRLGAIEVNAEGALRLTPDGAAMRRFPLHPRLARLIIAADGERMAIAIAAAISEGIRVTRSETTSSDAFALADAAPPIVVRELERIAAETVQRQLRQESEPTEKKMLRAILAAYPDRVAMRRGPRSERLLLASGSGAALARESGVRDGEFLVAIEMTGSGGEAIVRAASRVEREWLTPTLREVTHELRGRSVRAVERSWYGAILLHEQSVDPDPSEARRLLGRVARENVDPLLRQRLAFARLEVDWESLLGDAGRVDDYAALLPFPLRRSLDELAPASIPLPSGRSARLAYRDDGSVFAAVKLQELFGLAESPRVGPDRTPVTFELLAPNGRPVQVTRDLRSFWNGAYAEVRRELRARYPKHPWPEDPWTATPTHRTRRR